jgi:predicted amidohydrolase
MLVAAVELRGSADTGRNRQLMVDGIARAAGNGAEVVLLPEYATGFRAASPDPALAQPLDGPLTADLAEAARRHSVLVITGFLATSDRPGMALSCALTISPDGGRRVTPKVHLFDALGGRESRTIARSPLVEPPVVGHKGLNFGAMVCFDLRFPEVARKLVDAGADTIVVPAAWVSGDGKSRQWTTLLGARAIENVSYVIGVGLRAPRLLGESQAFDPTGEPCPPKKADDDTLYGELDTEAPARHRRRNPALDLRRFDVCERRPAG